MKKFAILALFLVITFESIIGVSIYFGFDTWGDRGTFGDMFGVANAFFSGLAFAGVIYAILMQQSELGLQRKELELTREEFKRSADIARQQSEHIATEAKKNELYKIIQEIDKSITNLLDVDFSIGVRGANGEYMFAFRSVLFDLSFLQYEKVIPKYLKGVEYAKEGGEQEKVKRLQMVEMTTELFSQLLLLGKTLLVYEEVSKGNVVLLYFNRRYWMPIKRLAKAGYEMGEYWEKHVIKSDAKNETN